MYNETTFSPAQAVGRDESHHPTFGEVGLFLCQLSVGRLKECLTVESLIL